jgi:tRNA-Thr(GGU) m(6)t(6)A37 methyltransferase TsaA
MSKLSDSLTSESVNFEFIGKVTSPYQEKFAIPRQPGLVNAAKGKISLINDANNEELVRGLEQFSHIWVLFVFHGTQQQGWKPLVRPPRLGGNKKTGVLATRSTFRPNPIGMSVVKLDSIEIIAKQVELHISGLDLLNGTPVVDIKPYIPYSDAITSANAGFAQQEPQAQLSVSFSEAAQLSLDKQIALQPELAELAQLIIQVLAQDPRPAYKQNQHDEKIYGMSLYDLNIQWQLTSLRHIEVLSIAKNKIPEKS